MKKIILAGLLALTQVAHADSRVKVFVDLPLFGAPVYVQPQRQYVPPVVTYNNGYYDDGYYNSYTTSYNANPYYSSNYVAPVIIYDNYRNNYYDNRRSYRDNDYRHDNRNEHYRENNDRNSDHNRHH